MKAGTRSKVGNRKNNPSYRTPSRWLAKTGQPNLRPAVKSVKKNEHKQTERSHRGSAEIPF